MVDTKLTIRLGHAEFRASGDPDWITQRLEVFYEKLGTLPAAAGEADESADSALDSGTTGEHNKATELWLKRHKLDAADLERVIHKDDVATSVIVGDVPGNTKSAKTREAYVLAGIAALVETGEPNFSDDAARSLCDALQCMNKGNHATYVAEITPTLMLGTKAEGWRLTSAGLKRGAELISQLTSES